MKENTPEVGDVLWALLRDNEAEPVVVIWVGKRFFNYTREDGTTERCQIRHVGHTPLGGFFTTRDEAYEKKAKQLLNSIDAHKAIAARLQGVYDKLVENWSVKK